MSRRRSTVAQLAAEADLDLDEAIVTLWDAGFDEISAPSDIVPASRVPAAKRALGLATPRELTSPEYWRRALQVDAAEFAQVLDRLQIKMTPQARRLPKGAIRKLKRLSLEQSGGIDMPSAGTAGSERVALPPLRWKSIGREQTIRYLTSAELQGVHACLEQDFANTDDPIEPPGIRAQHLLDSAAFRPMTSLGEVYKYPTVEMAAAALFHSLALNHAFHNGNKRTALVAMLVFLDEHGMQLTCPEEDLFRLVLMVAQHRIVPRGADELADREVMEIARWIRNNSRRLEHGDRVLKWVRLRRILKAFGCWTDFNTSVGNRINVYREVEVQRRFGRTRREIVRSQVYYGSEGSEVEPNTVTKLRRDLHLDEEHGVDSHSFYNMEIRPAEDFIVVYRKTLGRLAKL